jgi:hypothetical protein
MIPKMAKWEIGMHLKDTKRMIETLSANLVGLVTAERELTPEMDQRNRTLEI